MKELDQKNRYTRLLLALPKTDLHLHLDGSLRIRSLIEMAQALKISLPSFTENGLREVVFKDKYVNLGEYLKGFSYTCAVLRDKENIERSAYELAIDNQKEGVRYIEVRFAPQLNTSKKLSMEEVFIAVNNGLLKAQKEFNKSLSLDEPEFRYGIIACAMRMVTQDFSPYFKTLFHLHSYSSQDDVIRLGALELAKAVINIRDKLGIPIVGYDLAGQEDGYPAEGFVEAYNFVHKNFMHKTVHAGEAYGAESIFQAITNCNADRLGHCLYLFDEAKILNDSIKDKSKYIMNLVSFIAEKRITIEVCLSSNFQTSPHLKNIREHPLQKMIDHEISLSICTDNRLISNTTICKEFDIMLNALNLSDKQIKNIIMYGFKRSFLGQYDAKRKYVRKVNKFYDKIINNEN